MKKKDFLIGGILLVVIVTTFLNIVIGFFNNYTLFLFIILLIGIAYLSIGFPKSKAMIEKDVILSIIVYLVAYYLLTYIIGYFIGFTKSIYNISIRTIFMNTFPIILLIIATEIFRYIVNLRARGRKVLVIMSFVAFTLINSTIILSSLKGVGTNSMIQQLGLFILPAATTNILLTYLSIKVGYKSSIVYELLRTLPLYIIPIFPNFGDYIESVLRISLPIIFILWLYRKIDKLKVKKIILIEHKRMVKYIAIMLILLCALLVSFISSFFRLQAFVIATGSMSPDINVGDVVIVDKKSGMALKPGDVITYQKDNSVICHRIIKVIPSGDEVVYETKGDYNKTSDQLLVEKTQIIGVVRYRIRYIGYPTVLLNKFR